LQPETQKRLDSIIFEITAKMNAIVQEMNAVNFSDLDDVSKRKKTDRLRKEFQVTLNEQKIRVEEIMKDEAN